MQDVAPWTVCDARIREDPTKKVTNISKHNSTSYGFLAPFFDGHRYSGSTVRLKLATTMQEVQVTRTWINIMTCCVVNITREICALNRTEVRDSGAVRITTIDEYATASIEVNNTTPTTNTTATATTETEIPKTINVPAAPSRTEALDLTQTHDRLRGFVGGFAEAIEKIRDHESPLNWGFFAPPGQQ